MKLLKEELDEARKEIAEKARMIVALQAAHAEEVRRVELERDQIIQSLMESEERYRIHISATTAVTWHGNASGCFCVPLTSWSDFTGQEWPQYREYGWMEMILPSRQDSFADEWKKQIAIGKTFIIECPIWSTEHEEYRHCEMNGIPILNNVEDTDNDYSNEDNTSHSPKIYAWIGSVVDIHQRKLAEERILSTNELLTKTVSELQRSNMELEGFVYIASHDLKEPLRGMQNLATMLLELYGDKLDDEGLELLGLVDESGQRMQQLIDALLKYSRVTLAHDSFQQVNTDMLLHEMIKGLESLPGQRDFVVHRPHSLPNLLCNPAHLQTIFQNLLSNALKYNDAETVIIEIDIVDPKSIETDAPIFFVRDNGIGIHPNHHDLLFDMFRRLHSDDEYSGGTGAGLAIVKKILDQYGGQIWIDSELGSGCTFYFTLGGEYIDGEA